MIASKKSGVKQALEELERSKAALREIPRHQRIADFDKVLGLWLDGNIAFRNACEDISHATGYAHAAVTVSLRRTLEAWRAPHLERVLAEAESASGNHQAPNLVAAILAQNTPGLAIPPIALALGLGTPLLLKSAEGEPHLARHFLESLRQVSPVIAASCRAVYWKGGDRSIEERIAALADRILVYGGADAIDHWRSLGQDRVIAQGPRISVAILGSSTDDLEIEALAEQIAILDQHGCLSPQAILLPSAVDALPLAKQLAEALRVKQNIWPRRPLPDGEATSFRQAVDAAEIAVVGGRSLALLGGHAEGFGVEVTTQAQIEPCPLDRMIRFHPYRDPTELKSQLVPLRDNLECIGVTRDAPEISILQSSGARRICTIAEMQNPPADWHPVASWLMTIRDERFSTSPQLRSRFRKHVAQTSDAPRALEVTSARGCWVHTADGRKHLDLLAGIGVAAIGHAHPRVAAAVARQARLYTHVMVYGEDALDSQVKLAERLAARLPENLQSTYFTNSGAEAIEGALKLVRKATGRSRVLSFEGAFHGDTTGAVALGGNPVYREPFRPLLENVEQIPWDDTAALNLIDETTAGVFVEPVQAEAGVRVPSRNFLAQLRERCREVGALLVFDEVVTAFGRTGKFFGFEHWPEAVPDVLVLAKSLGGGLPLGAFVSSPEILACLANDPPLGHVTTFGGNPVCCAAALASLDILEEQSLPERSALMGRSLLERLQQLVGRGGLVEVRGLGMLIGLEFESPGDCACFVEGCRMREVLLGWTLHEDRVVRLAPPLILSEEESNEAVRRLSAALQGTAGQASSA